MRIDIWSDYVCPFCTIGERHLAMALEDYDGDVEIFWRSFQLDPTAPKEPTETGVDYLVKSKSMSREQVEQMLSGLAQRAEMIGLDFNWRDQVIANTFDAHRVGHAARAQGVGNEWDQALKHAYFTDGKNVASAETMKEIGTAIGLEASLIDDILASDQYADSVNEEIQAARQMGVNGVPFFVFDGKLAVSGAQPPAVFKDMLKELENMD
ncbi:DsbA family oxidoreductase [Corynebacterium breve]|uniref:DsbA family oxidoreductase n=1 Tax=Corynebacterium breve TaxID=3049799 RepID=A0ABY8VES3_9CORY|nr:DsbA family oxidoreductase [Corynebacterium breve]WIM67133.1 DsbA family oxidoreductase [Corynebacterium breve]